MSKKSRMTPEILAMIVEKRREGMEFKDIADHLNAVFPNLDRPFRHTQVSQALYRRTKPTIIMPFRNEVIEFLKPHYWCGEKTMAQLAALLSANFPGSTYTATSVRDAANRHGLERNPELLVIGTSPVRSAMARSGIGSWEETVALARLAEKTERPPDNPVSLVRPGEHHTPGGYSMLRPRQPNAGQGASG